MSSPPKGNPYPSLFSEGTPSCLHFLEATSPFLPFLGPTTPCFTLQKATLDRFPDTDVFPTCLRLTEVSSTCLHLNSYCLLPEATLTRLYLQEETHPYVLPLREGTPTCPPPPRGNRFPVSSSQRQHLLIFPSVG